VNLTLTTLGVAHDARNKKTTAPAKISRGPPFVQLYALDQGVISRITGLSRTDTATLLLGVTVVPVALTSGW
jgi:hypothetical protein